MLLCSCSYHWQHVTPLHCKKRSAKQTISGYSSFSGLMLEAAENNDALMSLHAPFTG